MRTPLLVLATLSGLASCGGTVDNQKPIGGTVDTDAEIQRFLGRAYLDLTGKAPTDDELATATTRLRDQSNTPTARAALVDELIAAPSFAKVWVEELENNVFGGSSLDDEYGLVCGIIRGTVPACMSCSLTDSCACACDALTPYFAERANLKTSATDFGGGMKSGKIERRYALARGYFVLAGTPEGRMKSLFDDFLARPAEADEIDNGSRMIQGAIIPGSPAGLMFHRHGASYDDLIDIVFSSEVYREAMVRRAFERYLAREPNTVELEHFATTLDATDPDVRPLARAVVASREYFAQ